MPKVSVIVPVFGVEKYIERCARSLFMQTLDDIEFLFIDDCSEDNSMNILDRVIDEFRMHIAEMNWTVRVERMQRNSGQAAVRFHGIQIATGDYVLFCDSDDWIAEDMLAGMWNLAYRDNLDVVVCDYYHVRGDENIYCLASRTDNIRNYFLDVLYVESVWALWNKLFKRSLYSNIIFPQKGMNMGEDMAMVIQLLYYCRNMGYINEPYYHYCDNANSICNDRFERRQVVNVLQWKKNIVLLDKVFKEKKQNKKIIEGITYLKYHQKRCFPLDINKYYCLWMSLHFHDLIPIMCNSHISGEEKRQYVKRYITGCALYVKNLI